MNSVYSALSFLRTQIYLWPKLGQIPFIGLWDIVFTRLFRRCLLWPWPLTVWTQNLISTSTNPHISLTKIGWIFFHWSVRYGVHNVFGSLPDVTLNFDLLTPKSNQQINEPKYVTKIGWNTLHWFLRYGVHMQGFRDAQTHALTHAQTDGQTRLQNASGFGTAFTVRAMLARY